MTDDTTTKTTTLATIRDEISGGQGADMALNFATERSFLLMQRVGNMFSSSSLVPKDYQGNLANCLIALEMANRIGAGPLQVMQNLYVVHGRPSWSSQFLIATFNSCGRFSALRYEFKGTPGADDYGCRAWAIEKSTGEKIHGSWITIALAKKEGWYAKSGSKWQTMEQQMLMYRSASWFVRAYAPEIAMGLHTVDEVQDFGDREPEFVTTLESLRPSVDVTPEPVASEPTPEPVMTVDKETGEVKQTDVWGGVPAPTKEEVAA